MGLQNQGLNRLSMAALALGISGVGLGSSLIAPAQAARSLTEQLHTPPEESIRQRQDVADEFLLLGQEQILKGEYSEAIVALQSAADAYHYLGDFVGMGEAYEQLVKIYSDLGRYREAERVVRQQLAVARSNVNFSDQILALNNLGTLGLQNGDLEMARAAFTEGLTVAQDVDSESGIGLSLSNLGLIAAAQGQTNDARKYYEIAANYRARARDFAGQANTDSNLGDVYLASGQIRKAIGAYRLSRSLAEDIGDPYIQMRALDGLIKIYRQRDEPRELSRYLQERIALTVSTGDDWQRLLTLRTLGEIYEDNGELDRAYEALSQAFRLAQMMERKTIQAELSNQLRSLSLKMND